MNRTCVAFLLRCGTLRYIVVRSEAYVCSTVYYVLLRYLSSSLISELGNAYRCLTRWLMGLDPKYLGW